ncbi:transporter substrate-binding domain-containing protein [Elioraea thermophila]|uniref:transporter substrate-binding domain-containing protein n=1 Tax=Elioraea thermophila TaxID=2185104 RepID=UPI000DF4895A|nr:transporter substrate-binding domain-containing protein [Elioraea thermophila]
MSRLAAALLAAALITPSLAAADALREAAERGTLRLGVRADAAPFSAADGAGGYAGYAVDLCRAVVERAARATGRPITAQFVAIDAGNRFAALAEGRIDLLCEATSRTLSRLDHADFTLPTFVTGPGLMVRLAPGAVRLPPLGGKGVGAPEQAPRRIGVLAGTTAERLLRERVARGELAAQIIEAATHQDGLAALTAGLTDAYAADLEILVSLRGQAADPAALAIADRVLGLETYALAVRPGARELRVLADRVIAEAARSGELVRIAARHFPGREPGEAFLALMLFNALPE